MRWWIKRRLYKLGIVLLRLNYVKDDDQKLIEHQLRLEVQELRRDISRLKLDASINKFKRFIC